MNRTALYVMLSVLLAASGGMRVAAAQQRRSPMRAATLVVPAELSAIELPRATSGAGRGA